MAAEPLGPAADEGYLPRGRRLNVRAERSASDRALDMLLARLGGAAPATEVPLPRYDCVPPPPAVVDLRRMALVTEGGLAGIEHDVIHGGYEAAWVREAIAASSPR